MNLLLPMTIASLLVTGMGLALLGSIKLALAQKLQIDEARVGGLISLFGFTMIPVILTAGVLSDWLGRQGMFLGGTLLMSLALVVLATARRYSTAMLAVLMLSAAWSAQVNVVNVITPAAFLKPSEIPERISYATNLGNVFFGVGAFLTPLLLSMVLRRCGLRTSLIALATLVSVPAILALQADFPVPSVTNGATNQAVNAGSLLADPVMWLCALAMFFYGPLEAAVAAWTTTYLGDKGVSQSGAASMLSVFWLSYMTARLLTAFWLGPWVAHQIAEWGWSSAGEAILIMALGLLSVAVMAGIVWSRSRTAALALVAAAGFVFGPIFPSIMAILLGHFPEALQGRAVGLLFAVGGLGWTTIPLWIGRIAQRTSLQRGFRVAVGCAVGLSLIGLALALRG
jgi:MFS family permease